MRSVLLILPSNQTWTRQIKKNADNPLQFQEVWLIALCTLGLGTFKWCLIWFFRLGSNTSQVATLTGPIQDGGMACHSILWEVSERLTKTLGTDELTSHTTTVFLAHLTLA